MFYTEGILTKQGPLSRIWLAAHWDKKLTKAVVFETNIESACDTVVNPTVKLALRTSGHLLLGVVRIYNRKARYLLADCNEAFMKIKLAFRSGLTIDLPKDAENAKNQIFLPDDLDLELTSFPEISQNELQSAMLRNTARIEEITRKHDVRNLQHSGIFRDLLREHEYEDDDFGLGENFDDWDEPKQSSHSTSTERGRQMDKSSSKTGSRLQQLSRARDDEEEVDILKELNENNDDMDLFGVEGEAEDAAGPPPPPEQMDDGGPGFDDISKVQSDLGSPIGAGDDLMDTDLPGPPSNMPPPPTPGEFMEPMTPGFHPPPTPEMQQGVLGADGQLLLSPIHPSQMEAPAPHQKPRVRKKRKLLIDGMMEITNSMMKAQLKDYSDIILPVDSNYDWLAPPTIRLVNWKEHGTTEPLFKHSFLADKNRDKQRILQPLQYAPGGNITGPARGASLDASGARKSYAGKAAGTPVAVAPASRRRSKDKDTQQEMPPPPPPVEETLPPPPPQETSEQQGPPPPPVEEENKEKDKDEEEPLSKRTRMGSKDLEETKLHEAQGLDSSMPPPPPAEISMEPPTPFNHVESKSLEESFRHINMKDLDDDKKRDKCMLELISADMDRVSAEEASFFNISTNQDRKRAARQFYALLMLRKQNIIQVDQTGPCEDIVITKSKNFDNAAEVLAN